MPISKLIHAIVDQYQLSLNGTHGVSHWARVLENGTRLAQRNGADLVVVQLFAIFHDAKRCNEWIDDDHGLRGAEYARILREDVPISDAAFELLYTACAYHTDGLTEADITIQTCWDADRLDLKRANITPRPERLCTQAARNLETLAWANERAELRLVPDFVRSEWNIWI